MKRIRKYDDNFPTLLESVPDYDVAVENCVQSGMMSIFQNIGNKLQLEDPDGFAWSIIQNCSGIKDIRNNLEDALIDYIKDYPIEEDD